MRSTKTKQKLIAGPVEGYKILNDDLTVQFGEDPQWEDLPPVDREKANKELE